MSDPDSEAQTHVDERILEYLREVVQARDPVPLDLNARLYRLVPPPREAAPEFSA